VATVNQINPINLNKPLISRLGKKRPSSVYNSIKSKRKFDIEKGNMKYGVRIALNGKRNMI